jgi:hypothetical protein
MAFNLTAEKKPPVNIAAARFSAAFLLSLEGMSDVLPRGKAFNA